MSSHRLRTHGFHGEHHASFILRTVRQIHLCTMKIGSNHELVPHLPLSAPKDDKGVRKDDATLAQRMSDGGWAPLRLKRADRHERPRKRQQSLPPSVEVLRERPPVRLIGPSVETDSIDVHALAIQLRERLSIDETGSADTDQGPRPSSPSSPAQSANAGTSQVLPAEYTNPKLSARIEGGNKQYLFEGKPVFPSYPHGSEKPEREFGMPRMEVGRGKYNVVTERYNEQASVYRKTPHNEYVETDIQRLT